MTLAQVGDAAKQLAWKANLGRSCKEANFLWVANHGSARITANSVTSLVRAGLGRGQGMYVCALDGECANTIEALVPQAEIVLIDDTDEWRDLSLTVPSEYSEISTTGFRRASVARYVSIRHLLKKFERPVVYADGDIAYLRNPARYFDSLQPLRKNLVLAQNDRRADNYANRWAWQYGPGRPPDLSRICSGFTVWQPIVSHYRLAGTVVRTMQLWGFETNDQTALNGLPNTTLRILKVLRQDLFPNGSMCFPDIVTTGLEREIPAFDWSNSYILHANWLVGMAAKENALRRAGLWFV